MRPDQTAATTMRAGQSGTYALIGTAGRSRVAAVGARGGLFLLLVAGGSSGAYSRLTFGG